MARDEAYREEAEKKIEEARLSGATELDLRGGWHEDSPKLTELPESLGHLTQLYALNLSNNQLASLSFGYDHFTFNLQLDCYGAMICTR